MPQIVIATSSSAGAPAVNSSVVANDVGNAVSTAVHQALQGAVPAAASTVAHHTPIAIEFTHSLVPLFGVVFVFGLPLAIVIAVLAYRSRRQRMVNEVILKLAEKGQPVPPELFIEPVRERSDLRRGIFWLMVGLGISIFGLFDSDSDLIGIGFIPMLIGVGMLIAHKLEKKDGGATGSGGAKTGEPPQE